MTSRGVNLLSTGRQAGRQFKKQNRWSQKQIWKIHRYLFDERRRNRIDLVLGEGRELIFINRRRGTEILDKF
jgi:hypothetical protein